MSTLTATQIEKLKRAAKELVRTSAITHSEALDRLAIENGFKNWSLLAKHGNRSTAVPAGPRVPPASTPPTAAAKPSRSQRYYLHGDQVEGDPTRFYCVQCDYFVDADHFLSSHPPAETLERCLNSVTRWERRPRSETAIERPIDAPNMLIQQARAVVVAREAARSPFHRWLEQHKGKKTILGDIARDVLSDKKFPVGATTYAEMQDYLERVSACDAAMEAMKAAWEKFQASVKRAEKRAAEVA